MYGAAPGTVVRDNERELFVSELLKEIRTPGKVEEAFQRTLIGVSRASVAAGLLRLAVNEAHIEIFDGALSLRLEYLVDRAGVAVDLCSAGGRVIAADLHVLHVEVVTVIEGESGGHVRASAATTSPIDPTR
jgi:hypothetical protein